MAIDTLTMDQIISNVFDEMLAMPTDSNPPADDVFEQQRIVASIQISGIVEELIVVEAPTETAHLIAQTMFDADPDSLEQDEINDAVGEVVNMIGGNVKGTYEGESTLSLPCVGEETGPPDEDPTLCERTIVNVSGQPILIRWRDVAPVAVASVISDLTYQI